MFYVRKCQFTQFQFTRTLDSVVLGLSPFLFETYISLRIIIYSHLFYFFFFFFYLFLPFSLFLFCSSHFHLSFHWWFYSIVTCIILLSTIFANVCCYWLFVTRRLYFHEIVNLVFFLGLFSFFFSLLCNSIVVFIFHFLFSFVQRSFFRVIYRPFIARYLFICLFFHILLHISSFHFYRDTIVCVSVYVCMYLCYERP